MADSNHTCVAVTSLDSALKKDENYPQVFLKECKYIKKKLFRHIHDNMSLMKNRLFLINTYVFCFLLYY